jgi:hypothetical protein
MLQLICVIFVVTVFRDSDFKNAAIKQSIVCIDFLILITYAKDGHGTTVFCMDQNSNDRILNYRRSQNSIY